MGTRGVVRTWDDERGWGVVDSDETPGGCWAGFGAVAVEGFRTLQPGEAVELEWERAPQDGFAFRATRTWPVGQVPVPPHDVSGSGAYASRLTITFDEPEDPRP